MDDSTKKIILAHISDVQSKLDTMSDDIKSITKNNEIIKIILNEDEKAILDSIDELFKS